MAVFLPNGCVVENCNSKTGSKTTGACAKHQKELAESGTFTNRKCLFINCFNYVPKQPNAKFCSIKCTGKASNMWSKYGVSVNEYNFNWAQQHGKCFICKKYPKEYLVIDHDHKTNLVRGLICVQCNAAFGMVDDSIETLKSMIEYLESARINNEYNAWKANQ